MVVFGKLKYFSTLQQIKKGDCKLIGFHCICSSINNDAFNQIQILIPTSIYDNESIQANDDNRSGENGVLTNN